MTREAAIKFLKTKPYLFGHKVGFERLGLLHNGWIVDMAFGKQSKTLQAHRSSYKTTCVSLALALIILLRPNKRTLFLRKTDDDVKEIVEQVKKILTHPVTQAFALAIWGVQVKLVVSNANEISTNLTNDPRGSAQLIAMGCGSSLTGKHFDFIFTDDIININDRVSRAERERTKLIYGELLRLQNAGGRIFNTGTPWHKDDAFSVMPEAERFSVYDTGMLTADEIEVLRHDKSMTPSLFAANYELRHIAADGQLFKASPTFTPDKELLSDGVCHIDAAYGGEDSVGVTIGNRRGGKMYALGMKFNKHVDLCLPEILAWCATLRVGLIICELNADKGYLVKELRQQGYRAQGYSETMNKHQKISTYLYKWWENMVWLEGTSKEYLNDIMDYTEDAEHDDCADSAASFARYLDKG